MQQEVRSGPIDCPAPTPPDPFAIKAFEHAGVCLAVIDSATHRLLSCNRAFARLLGHPVAALIGESWLALHSADTPGAVRNFHARSVDAGPWVYEARLVLLSGATVPVEVSVCDVPETPGGAPYRVISLKDLTGCAPTATAPEPPASDRRAAPPGPASGQIEEQLRRELERLRSIIENTRAGTWEWNIQTGEAVFDPGWADMIGYDLAELQPISIATWQRLTHPDDLRRAGDLLARHLSGETPRYECESRLRHKAGHWVWVLGRGRLLSRTADGKPLRVIGAHTDISATKAAQAALLENEERLRTALDAARMATFERDIASARITWSPRHEAMWGYAPGEFDGTDAAFERRIHPDDLPRIRAAVQRCVADGKPTTDEFRVVWPDGSVRWMNSSGQVTFDETGRPRHIRGVVIDVTERRESEAALQRTKETLVEAQRIAHVGSFEFVAATRTTAWSEEEFRIYGLDPAERSPDYEALLARHIHPDDAARLHAVFSKAVETRSVYELEHRVVHPDGTVRWVFDRALPYFGADGTLVRYVGTTLDITNRKRAEESMRERERQFRSMVQSSPIATAFVRTDGRVEIVNRRFTELFGYEVHDIPTLADWFRQAYPDDAYRRKVIEGWQAATDPGAARPDGGPRERRVACKSGKVRIVEFTTIVMVDGVLVKMVDLTDRKQAEDALQEREALLAQAMTQADLAYWNFDAATGVLTLNDWFYALLGTSAEREGGYEMQVDRYAREFLPAEEQPSVAGELQRSGPEGGGAEWRIEHRIRRRDGAIRHVVVRAVQVREPDGRIAGTRGVVQDITDRKEMETTLRENEARLRLALGAAQAGMWEWDVGTNDNIWSAEVWALYGLDPQRWPASYQAWIESIPPEDRATITRRVDAAAREGAEIEIEWRVNLPGNEPRWLLSLGRPEKDRAGRVVRYRGIVVNITARKQAEARLAEQMAELRRWYAATVGRESRVLELKAEVNQLLRAAGKAPKYGSAEDSIAPPGRAQTPGRT